MEFCQDPSNPLENIPVNCSKNCDHIGRPATLQSGSYDPGSTVIQGLPFAIMLESSPFKRDSGT